jgi:hypothetical protein
MLLHKSVEFDSRVRREASALAAAGHKVIVLELSEIPDADRTLDGFTRSSCLPSQQVGQKLPAPLCRLLTLLLFVIAIMKIRPDVVHVHDAPMLLPGLIGARLTGARIVYDSHEFATSVPRSRWSSTRGLQRPIEAARRWCRPLRCWMTSMSSSSGIPRRATAKGCQSSFAGGESADE